MRLSWTSPASHDLAALHSYVRAESFQAADRILDQIVKATEMLVRQPRLGRTGRIAGTRELVIVRTPFLVVNQIREDTIQILAVLHGKRRWPKYF